MRLHFFFALITGLLLMITLRSHERNRFTFEQVQSSAEKLARTPFVELPDVLPAQLKRLTPDQERGIFWKDLHRLWRKKGLPFQVDFFHISNECHTSPIINVVDGRGEHRLAYSPTFFSYLNLTFNPPLPSNLGYAGFYVRYPINKPDSLDGFFSVLGSSYFRIIAKNQIYGLSGRGLAINAGADGKSEEFPQFKEWWLHEPASNAREIVMDALLDSPSVTGAYGFKIHPGAVTSVDVHATLFFRKPISWMGIAPFSSMYLYGQSDSNHFGNPHPEIHDSDGVLIHTGKDDWIWRPLGQAPLFQVYQFNDENPRGFGLLQRDRDFQHYQDLDLQYNVRPSVWVVPHGTWGKGSVVLDHRPSTDPNIDNVVLFWHPDQIPQAGERMELDYTLNFYMNDATLPPLAYSPATFIVNPAPPSSDAPSGVGDTTPVQFMIDFAGSGIEGISPSHPPHLYLHFDPPKTVLRESNIQKIGFGNSWRASFTIIPFKHHIPTEMHCRLMENASKDAKPLSEEWTYTWHQ